MLHRFARARVAAGVLGVMIAFAPAAAAQGWGTVKGQVTVEGQAPQRKPIAVTKDQEHCQKHGDLLSEDYVVNPRNKGVRWVVVWLIDANSPTRALPVHPSLKSARGDQVEMDQPTCQFEPHVVALREGQTLLVKNSAEVTHNVNIQGGISNPSLNYIMPPKSDRVVTGWKGSTTPVQVTCNIHPWMKAYVRVFKHPYFAVTDADGNFEIKNAPAGEFRLVAWQESVGWLLGSPTRGGGKPITIKEGGVTDLGPITLKPE